MDKSSSEDKTQRYQELKVLEGELASLKKGAHIYKQQRNSNVFFMVDNVSKVTSEVKKELKQMEQQKN